jgi:hypothetical protein
MRATNTGTTTCCAWFPLEGVNAVEPEKDEMLGVKVQIARYADDWQPGWVECRLTDAHGRLWSFVEKVPVVTSAPLDSSSIYPQPGVIACEVVERVGGVVRIDTTRPWGVESVEGETRFEVAESLLVAVSS